MHEATAHRLRTATVCCGYLCVLEYTYCRMVAGRGILHSEMPSGDGRAHGLQLWVNLPKREKACKPSYQELKAEAVPRVTQDGVTATIIAGTAFGTTSPVRTKTPTMFLDFKMERGSTLTQAIPYAWNAFLYVLSGSVRVGGSSAAAADEGDAPTAGGGERHDDGTLAEAHTTVTLSCGETEDGVFIRAVGRGAHFVLIAGEPIGEPVVQHGTSCASARTRVRALACCRCALVRPIPPPSARCRSVRCDIT
ncbi:pirin family protein [archaeon]|nr:MAG: pirin family protein [archaeon]